MKNRVRGALVLTSVALMFATGCRKQDPATAENRDSSVDKQSGLAAVQNNPNIPPQARAMVEQQVRARAGYSSGPTK